MNEVEITLDMIDKARSKSAEMGVLKNSIIRGSGIYGAVASTLKNTIIKCAALCVVVGEQT